MKKILMLLGFLIAGLTAFRCLDAALPSEEEQKQAKEEAAQAFLQEIQGLLDGEIDKEVNRRINAIKVLLKRTTDTEEKKKLFAKRAALSTLLEERQRAASRQREIEKTCAGIREYVQKEAIFRNLKDSDLGRSSAFYLRLSRLGVLEGLNQNKENLIRVAIINFLATDKENLTQDRLKDLKDLEELLKNIKLLKPAEEKKEAPKSKTLEEKKEDPRPKTKKVEKIAPTEEKEEDDDVEDRDVCVKAFDQLIELKKYTKWRDGDLLSDKNATKRLPSVLKNLMCGRFKGKTITKFSPHFYDVHVDAQQRLYFASETINGKNTLILLLGGKKTDQEADIKRANLVYAKFRSDYDL